MRWSRAVLLLAACLFLCNLWGYDVWAPDEPYFAEGAREMVVDGHWLVPHVNGVVSTDKPPLFFWSIALLSLLLGGVGSLSARLPSVLAALGTVALVLRLGRRRSGEGTAVLAVFVLATSYMFWEKARWAQIDALLCFLIWVALSAFEAFRAGEIDGRRAGLVFWLAAGLAVLAKGPVGLLLPLGVALVTLAIDRDLRCWRRFAPLAGPALFVALVAAWAVTAELWGPASYSLWGALKTHFVERGIHGMHHRQPPWYYLSVLPIQLLPWSGLVPGALVLAWRRRDRFDRFLLVAALFVVVFFSISTEKRGLYVLPAFPAFALMTSRFVASMVGWERAGELGRRWLTVGQTVVGGLLALVGIALPLATRRVDEIPHWMACVLAALLFASGAATLAALARRRLAAVALAPAAGLVAAYLFVAVFVYPALNPSKSARAFALTIKQATAASRAAGHQVLACDLSNLPEPFAFFSDGVYTVETQDVGALARHLEQDAVVYAVADRRRLEELPQELRERLLVVALTRLSRRDVVLVANRAEGTGVDGGG